MEKVRLTAVPSPGKKKPRGRPFESGNTAGKGRPKGSLNKMTQLVKEIWSEHAEDVAEKTATMAKAGDAVALRLFWERMAPVRAGAPVQFDMPTVLRADDVAPAYNAVLQGIADGQLTPAEAGQITRILESVSKVVAFQFGPPWQPDIKTMIERIAAMREEDTEAADSDSEAADLDTEAADLDTEAADLDTEGVDLDKPKPWSWLTEAADSLRK